MTKVHQLNQDNILDDDLSPNEFTPQKGGVDADIEDGPRVSPKRKSTLLPLVGFLAIALGFVVFFGWKIAAPYFNHGGVSRDEFTPAAAPAARVQSFDTNANTLADLNVPTAPSALNSPPMQTPQVPLNTATSSGGPLVAQRLVSPGGVPAILGPLGPLGPLVGQAQAVIDKAVLPAGPSADEIVLINKRIDNLGVALASLKDVVEKLKLQSQAKQASVSHVDVVATPKPVLAITVAPKPKPAVAKKIATPAPKIAAAKKELKVEPKKVDAVKSENSASGGMQLQAVLQDRAWFKTANGETVTVSPGEELKGVGIVQQVDADSGRVVFTNGLVYR